MVQTGFPYTVGGGEQWHVWCLLYFGDQFVGCIVTWDVRCGNIG